MKGLAQFVMRGRLQALMVILIGVGSVMFCWISAAALALVTLRKGVGEGAWMWFWALLPTGMLAWVFGDAGPLALLTGGLVLAAVLRTTVNLPMTVLVSIPIGVVTGLAMLTFGGEYIQQILTLFGEFLGALEQQLAESGEAITLPRPTALQIAGMLGAGTAGSAVVSLFLARYWQAALYNPGGFGEEFRALCYPPAVTALLALVMVGLYSLGLEYRSWALICALPLTMVGLALVHARVASLGQGAGWLAGFYMIWLIFDAVKILVVFAAIADSWLNFRRRWATTEDKDL